MANYSNGIQGFDEAVEEARAYMESGAGDPASSGGDGQKVQIEMITIKQT